MRARRQAKKGSAEFAALAGLVEQDMRRLHIPGVALGVWHAGREHAAGFGVTSVEHPLPVTPDTLFQTGSISKTFTGTLLVRLAESGAVELDQPVRRYIKGFKLRDRKVAQRVTLRHLLTHVGGWVGDYFNDFGNGDDALDRMVRDLAQLPQVMPLGVIWSYNNTGFNIAARVIEIVTRLPYEQAVQEMLFVPIGLKMSFFFPSDELITHRFAVGHQRVGRKTVVARPWAIGRAGNGVGGVVSSVRDLLKYARFHMGDGRGASGKRVMRASSLRAMRVPQVDAGGRGQMGLTWFIRAAGGLTLYSHGGATNGQQALLLFIPEKKFALAALTNSDDGSVLYNRVVDRMLEVYFQIKRRDPKPHLRSAAELRPFTGRYRIGTECFDLKPRGGRLIYYHIPLGGFPRPDSPPGPAMPPVRFAFYAPDKVIGLDEPMKNALGDFFYDRRGRVKFFRIGGRAHKKIRNG